MARNKNLVWKRKLIFNPYRDGYRWEWMLESWDYYGSACVASGGVAISREVARRKAQRVRDHSNREIKRYRREGLYEDNN